MFCSKCGEKGEDDAIYCKKCGASLKTNTNENSFNDKMNNFSKKVDEFEKKIEKGFMHTKDNTKEFDQADIKENKTIAILCYLSFLVFIPMFSKVKSEFLKFHTKQGLNLFIVESIVMILYAILSNVFATTNVFYAIKTVPWYISIPFSFISIVLVAISFTGLYHVLSGKAQELPFVDKYRFIK